MTTLNKVLLAIIIILALALGGIVLYRGWFSSSPYYAVYLRTGDLYFGKLQRFPNFSLRQVYLLRVNEDDTQNPFRVQKFKEVFWGPEDYLRINDDEVVWMTKLDDAGQLAQLLKNNPDLVPTASAPAATTAPEGSQEQPAE